MTNMVVFCRFQTSWPVLVVMLLVSVSSGLLLGGAQWLVLALLCALVLPSLALMSGWFAVPGPALLLCSWAIMLTFHVIQMHSGMPIGYLFETLLLITALVSIRSVLRLAKHDPSLTALILLLCLYLAITVLSTILGRSTLIAALWQLQYNLKWPLMFGLGTMLAWSFPLDRMYRHIVAWSWAAIVPFVLMEIVLPDTHATIFGPAPDNHINPLIGFGDRYRGIFPYSGYLAIACALMSASALIYWLRSRQRLWLYACAIYFSTLVLSGQRQELLALVVLNSLLYALHARHRWPLLIGIFLAGLSLAAGIAYFDINPIQSVVSGWQFTDSISKLSERAVLTAAGTEAAEQYFPLGSGLGTYGGAGAQKFDLSYFYDLGFQQYWWFRQRKFLVDVYWPNIIAESGFTAGFVLFSFFVLMWGALLVSTCRSINASAHTPVPFAFAAMTLLLLNTPSSAIITDPRGAFVFWLLIGAGWRATVGNMANVYSGHSVPTKRKISRSGLEA